VAGPMVDPTGTRLYFGGKLVKSDGAVVVTDRLGSVRANSSGERMSYYPYGEERTSTANGREKFGTYTRDDATQDYADQRYYTNVHGRFFTPDPSTGSDPADPNSWNRYSYFGGDPSNWSDPAGPDRIRATIISGNVLPPNFFGGQNGGSTGGAPANMDRSALVSTGLGGGPDLPTPVVGDGDSGSDQEPDGGFSSDATILNGTVFHLPESSFSRADLSSGSVSTSSAGEGISAARDGAPVSTGQAPRAPRSVNMDAAKGNWGGTLTKFGQIMVPVGIVVGGVGLAISSPFWAPIVVTGGVAIIIAGGVSVFVGGRLEKQGK
jgi:RHS repeat-associated protein